MKCHECGGNYQQKFDLFEYDDPLVGVITLRGLPYYKCDKNGEILLTAELTKALDAARNNRVQELLCTNPISDFISAKETAELLGITRQALHKNRRIRHGFIYQIDFCGVTVYLKQSVIQFKKTGDGRFPLYSSRKTPSRYIKDMLPIREKHYYFHQSNAMESVSSYFNKYHIKPEVYCHAN